MKLQFGPVFCSEIGAQNCEKMFHISDLLCGHLKLLKHEAIPVLQRFSGKD